MSKLATGTDAARFMRHCLRLARRALGRTSPNPMVGALIVRDGKVLGEGWHHAAGQPHAEIEAIRHARANGHSVEGATLYVTLEPCSTHGRTPPCTQAIIDAGIAKVIVGAVDPNPLHAGRAAAILNLAGVQTHFGVLEPSCVSLNEAFNHWITTRTPLVTVKAAMTLDGKIATVTGESKWITGPKARDYSMRLRYATDAILVGIHTVLSDDPSLTVRGRLANHAKQPLRVVLDSRARTPLSSKLVTDDYRSRTVVFVTDAAPKSRVTRLAKTVSVVTARACGAQVDLEFVLRKLGERQITSLLVEGGGTVNASFFNRHLAQRVVFFYAPIVLGGRAAARGVAGQGVNALSDAPRLQEPRWRRLGQDWLLTAKVAYP